MVSHNIGRLLSRLLCPLVPGIIVVNSVKTPAAMHKLCPRGQCRDMQGYKDTKAVLFPYTLTTSVGAPQTTTVFISL